MRLTNLRSTFLIISSVLLISIFFCFWHLGDFSIRKDSDEVIHIRVTQEMLHEGHWWPPTHGGAPYWNKPPLKMWLTLIPLKLWGESNFSYRFLDALAAIGTCLLISFLALRFFSSLLAAFLAPLIFLAIPSFLLGTHGIRVATQDSLLVFFSTAALLAAMKLLQLAAKDAAENCLSRIRPQLIWGLFFSLFVGLSMLTKSAAGLMPLIIFWVFVLLNGKSSRVSWPIMLQLTFLSLLFPAAYLLPHLLQDSSSWKIFFVREIFLRSTTGIHNAHEPMYYLRELFVRGVVLSGLLLALALLFTLVRAAVDRDRRYLFLLLWALLPVLLYSFIRTRLPWYIAVSFPALALIEGLLLAELVAVAQKYLRAKREELWTARSILRTGSLLVLVGIFCTAIFLLSGRLVRSARFIQKQTQRLPLDYAVSDILDYARRKNPATKVLALLSPVRPEANPARGRFGIEAIYYRMLLPYLQQVRDVSALNGGQLQTKADFAIFRFEDRQNILQQRELSAYRVLEPARFRPYPIVVAFFGPEHDFKFLEKPKKVIYFSKASVENIHGLGRVVKAYGLTGQILNGRRFGVRIVADRLYQDQGTKQKINLFYDAAEQAPKVQLEIYLNERWLTSFSLRPRHVEVLEFSIPPTMWELGENELRFVLSPSAPTSSSPVKPKGQLIVSWLSFELGQP